MALFLEQKKEETVQHLDVLGQLNEQLHIDINDLQGDISD